MESICKTANKNTTTTAAKIKKNTRAAEAARVIDLTKINSMNRQSGRNGGGTGPRSNQQIQTPRNLSAA
jgi:hypothetical protein